MGVYSIFQIYVKVKFICDIDRKKYFSKEKDFEIDHMKFVLAG